MSESLPLLVELKRGSITEARHHGAIVAVEPDGRVITRIGDERLVASTRSAIKPIQAIPFISSGAAERFNASPTEVAVVCASHEGEPIHTDTVGTFLARVGLGEGNLLCGAHRPYSEAAAARLEREGLPFTQLHNNCSGKHSGMLATAVHRGLATKEYVAPTHSVQEGIISVLTRITGARHAYPIAIDGCSAPTFGMPLIDLALAFARLTNPWVSKGVAGFNADEINASKWIVAAMTSHPEMVGGTTGRLDTDLMRAARGRLIAKIGAEALYAVGVLPCEAFPRGLGLAIKIADGSKRALMPVVVETLAQLGLLDERELEELVSYLRPGQVTHRGLRVGELLTMFHLGFEKRHS